MNVAVIGAGSWGTTVAHLIAQQTPTTLWARREDLARQIADDHVNADYLPTTTCARTCARRATSARRSTAPTRSSSASPRRGSARRWSAWTDASVTASR